jgi:hypothetical protein
MTTVAADPARRHRETPVPANDRPSAAQMPCASEQPAEAIAEVLNRHLNADGRCSASGSGFPCDRAILAEHNTVLL